MDPLGLVHALQELQTKYYDRTGIVLVFDNRTTDLGLSVEEESQVFHIMQEALANVARHSGAKHARLTVELVGGEYRFAVEDDGLGFSPSASGWAGRAAPASAPSPRRQYHARARAAPERVDRNRQSAARRRARQPGVPGTKWRLCMKTVRVMLVDDHTLFRRGLAELLHGRNGIEVVAATAGATEAARLMQEKKPDVLLLDLNLPPHGGLALLRTLQDYGWSGPTLILTVSDSEDDLANALHAGARGYLLKDMEPEDVTDAILRAVRGETVVAPAMTMKLVDLLQPGGKAKPGRTCWRSSPSANARFSSTWRRACRTRRSRARSTSAMTRSSCTCAISCRS